MQNNKEIRKRKSYDLETKYEIINKFKNENKSKAQLAAEYGCPITTISTMLEPKNVEKIMQLVEDDLNYKNQKRIKKGKYDDVLQATSIWFGEVQSSKKCSISGLDIQMQAQKYATMLGKDDFKGSNGWLRKFKRDTKIKRKKIVGEGGLVDEQTIDDWKLYLNDLIKDYDINDIFNADELGLFYCAMPEYTYTYKNLRADYFKSAKKRITILLCSNWSGTEKIKPLVITNANEPRCFRQHRIQKSNLPVYYRSNTKAWMTSNLFDDWLKILDRKMKQENRKILLFVDNVRTHKTKLKLENINLVFFPANTTSRLQPLDQGIIHSFKAKYRTQLVREKLEALEQNSTIPKITVLSAIQKIEKAWIGVTSTTINNCFRKAGFNGEDYLGEIDTISSIDESREVENIYQNYDSDFNMDAYVRFDDNIETHASLNDDEIIEEVQNNQNANDSVVEEDDENDIEIENNNVITTNTAAKLVKDLKIFLFSQKDDTSNIQSHLLEIEKYVSNLSYLNIKQSQIDKYFKSSS
jgi:hypothetical protein